MSAGRASAVSAACVEVPRDDTGCRPDRGAGVDRVASSARPEPSCASQVQSTSVPLPSPVATTFPLGSETTTVHGSASVSVAVKRTKPPGAPVARGE